MKPSIGQVSNLAHYLSREEWVIVQFGADSEIYTALSNATEAQFEYIKDLRRKPVGKTIIRDILFKLGLKPLT